MPKYVIERDLPGVGKFTIDQLKRISQTSCSVLRKLGHEIQWIESFVTGDKNLLHLSGAKRRTDQGTCRPWWIPSQSDLPGCFDHRSKHRRDLTSTGNKDESVRAVRFIVESSPIHARSCRTRKINKEDSMPRKTVDCSILLVLVCWVALVVPATAQHFKQVKGSLAVYLRRPKRSLWHRHGKPGLAIRGLLEILQQNRQGVAYPHCSGRWHRLTA